jgi:GNAT superfamily N-acetyltransferase
VRISVVGGPSELAAAKSLLEEYWEFFGFAPCFQGFDAELAMLPGDYAAPDGRLALAWIGQVPAGCIALRRFDSQSGEAKRLYVRPAYRKLGIGRGLVEWLIAESRSIGYAQLVCDTMPQMKEALAMYARLGFVEIGPYAPDPTPGAIYLRLKL